MLSIRAEVVGAEETGAQPWWFQSLSYVSIRLNQKTDHNQSIMGILGEKGQRGEDGHCQPQRRP